MRIRCSLAAGFVLISGTIYAVGADPRVGPHRIGQSPIIGPTQGSAPTIITGHSDDLPGYFKTGRLDRDARVWAQTQIERIFYNHRIWPKENKTAKPPFEEMVPAE